MGEPSAVPPMPPTWLCCAPYAPAATRRPRECDALLALPVSVRARNGWILAAMVIVDVVLETYDVVEFAAWPIAEPSSDGLLALSGQMSPVEVGTAMAVIFSYNHIPVVHAADMTDAHLEQHFAEREALIAPGGLRFRDTTTNVNVSPGCCFGLENWRDWWNVAHGQ